VDTYVQSFPLAAESGGYRPNGGFQPRWRGDGREIYYVAPDNHLMAADVQLGHSVQVGVPNLTFAATVSFEPKTAFGRA
jgi:hypothetical protein